FSPHFLLESQYAFGRLGEITDWSWCKRAKPNHRLYHHSLECGIDCARRVTGRRPGAGETLPHLLVAALRVCETAGLLCGRRARSYPEFLRDAAGAQGFGCSTSGERTVAFLFVGIVQELPAEGASSRSGAEARRRQVADSTR